MKITLFIRDTRIRARCIKRNSIVTKPRLHRRDMGCDAEYRCEKERTRVIPDVDLCLDKYLRGRIRNSFATRYRFIIKQLELAFESRRVLNSGDEIENEKELS